MISYHLNTSRKDWAYASGWRTADVLDINRIAKCVSTFTWSPCTWAGNYRNEANFIQAQFCVLDFDDGELPMEQAVLNFSDCIHIIGPTKSHRIKSDKNPTACDRFRVILLFEHQITDGRLYKWNMKKNVDEFGTDKQCINSSRYFHPCKEIVSASGEGYMRPVDIDIPEDFGKPRVFEYHPVELASKSIPARVYTEFDRNFHYFNRNKAVFFFALAVAPFDLTPEEIIFKIKATRAFSKYQQGIDDDAELLRTIRNGLKKSKECEE